MTKQPQKTTNKILDIDDKISLHCDFDQYIIHYGKKYCYFSSLEQAFNDLFETKVRMEMIKDADGTIEKILEIHKETGQFLKNIFRSIENPKLK